MAQEIVINTWCDREHDENQYAETLLLKIAAHPYTEIDLCSECIAELVEPLAEALLAHGRKPSAEGMIRRERKAATASPSPEPMKSHAGGSSRRPYPCILCPDLPDFHYNTMLGKHFVAEHGAVNPPRGQGATMRDLFGDVCPLCAATSEKLGSHGRQGHGIQSSALLFKVALEQGDPHQVVRKRFPSLPG